MKILAAIVDTYVETGEPVGSKVLALDLGVSSATVRNEMADLAEQGLLEQPHTSAGRIPSQKGYRVYIDSLMQKEPLSRQEQMYWDGVLSPSAYDAERLLDSVSQNLAGITKCAAVSTTPCGSLANVRAVQFVQTSRRTAMVVLLTTAGTMKTRVFRCDFDLTPDILRIFFRVLNEKLAGMPVSSITPAFVQSLGISLGEMTMLISSALMAVLEVAQDSMETEVCLNGQMNLLFYPEFENSGVRRVMDFLERPQELSRLLLEQQGNVKVLIGRENRRPELNDFSVVVAHYAINGNDAGAIGVIGPTRMNYAKLIPNMEYLSKSVSRMLTDLMKEE